jgi:hypothetical protein
MNWPKLLGDSAAPFADLPRIDSLAGRYVPLVLLAVLLAVLLTKAVRTWQEIHEVEEPATPDELLASLEDAHEAGELDDEEIAKVRQQLGSWQTGPGDARNS